MDGSEPSTGPGRGSAGSAHSSRTSSLHRGVAVPRGGGSWWRGALDRVAAATRGAAAHWALRASRHPFRPVPPPPRRRVRRRGGGSRALSARSRLARAVALSVGGAKGRRPGCGAGRPGAPLPRHGRGGRRDRARGGGDGPNRGSGGGGGSSGGGSGERGS